MSNDRKRSEVQLKMSVADPVRNAKIRRTDSMMRQNAIDTTRQDSMETEPIRNGVDRSPIPRASKRIRELEELTKHQICRESIAISPNTLKSRGEPTKVENVRKSVKVTKTLSFDQPLRRSTRISRILNPLKILRSDSDKTGAKTTLRKSASVDSMPSTSKTNTGVTRASVVTRNLGVKVLPTAKSPKLMFSPILEKSIETASPLSSVRTAVTPVKLLHVTAAAKKRISLAPIELKPSFDFELSGTFIIEMEKVESKLGFTFVHLKYPSIGFYIQTLLGEPAISDGRIQVGDKILSVNGIKILGMEREDVRLAFRTAGSRVQLCLHRQAVEWIDGNNNEVLSGDKFVSPK